MTPPPKTGLKFATSGAPAPTRGGGSSAARTGRYFEARAEAALIARGCWTLRSPGSLGAVDLVALLRGAPPLMCQVKRHGAGIRPAGWNALYAIALQVGGVPLLVDCPVRGHLRWQRLLGPRAVGERTRLPLAPFDLGAEW